MPRRKSRRELPNGEDPERGRFSAGDGPAETFSMAITKPSGFSAIFRAYGNAISNGCKPSNAALSLREIGKPSCRTAGFGRFRIRSGHLNSGCSTDFERGEVLLVLGGTFLLHRLNVPSRW